MMNAPGSLMSSPPLLIEPAAWQTSGWFPNPIINPSQIHITKLHPIHDSFASPPIPTSFFSIFHLPSSIFHARHLQKTTGSCSRGPGTSSRNRPGRNAKPHPHVRHRLPGRATYTIRNYKRTDSIFCVEEIASCSFFVCVAEQSS